MALSPEQNVWLLKFLDNLRSIHYYVVSTAFCNMEDIFFLQKTRWRAVKVSRNCGSHLSSFLDFNRQTTKRGFHRAGIVVLPRHLNHWKFHAPFRSSWKKSRTKWRLYVPIWNINLCSLKWWQNCRNIWFQLGDKPNNIRCTLTYFKIKQSQHLNSVVVKFIVVFVYFKFLLHRPITHYSSL